MDRWKKVLRRIRAAMLVEVIMRNRMFHVVAIQAEMLIHGDHISYQMAEVGHRVIDHDQHQPHTMGMMMEEVSNKIHIEPSSTSQLQIIMHAFLTGNPPSNELVLL